MADKNSSEKHRPSFVAAFAMIGLGLGVLLYVLGYKSDVIAVGLFLGVGLGLLVDGIIKTRK